MSTSINTNLASLFAQNSLSGAQNRLAGSVQRLSSGLRINSAKDDAAGLAIAQNMQSQINGVNQSIRNLSDATNLIQTAESSLATIQDMLLRMKQLSTQGYNGSLSATQKNALVNELGDLNSEINATAKRTQFNGIDLLSSGQKIDSTTGDIFAGGYLTKTAVAISSSGDLDGTGKYSLSTTKALSSTGSSTYTVTTDNDSFRRDMVGTYTFAANDDKLTLSFTDADGKLSQQTLVVNNAQYDAPSQTTTQELDFNEFGIKLTLENMVEISDEIVYGADIATIFNAKTLIYSGQSSQITNVRLNGTESTTYSLTHNNTMEVQTVTMVTGTTANDALTLNGLTFTDLAGNATGAEVAAAFSNGTTGRKAGDVVSVTVAGDYTITGTVGNYDMTNTAGSAALVLTASTASVLGDQDLVTITEKNGGANTGNLAASAAQTTAGATSNILTLSYTDNAGAAHSTNLTLANADFLIDSDSTITFEDAGISIDLHNYQTQTASEIAYLLSTKYGVPGDDGSVGKLKVLQSDTAQLGFQSGPTTEAFIKVNTLNVMTGSTGVDEGASGEMMAVGSLITSSLADLDSSSSDLEWQSVFSSLGAAIDDAIDYISTERAVFGSQVNRLSFMTTNMQANSTNLQNSRSSIIDTDFAAETAALTKGQIMQQAATAMLAQANQMPNVILSLLK